jgi:outer membrane biosynthesis protein TonB
LDPELDLKAIECVRSWRFRPARSAGKPIASTATVEVVFHL